MSPDNNATGFPAVFRQPAKSHPNDAICGHGRGPCPICIRPMVVRWMFGIGIDACPVHGEWCNTGELNQLAAAVAREKREEQSHGEAE